MEVPFRWDIRWEDRGLNPADDTFLSSSRDRMVRLWTAQSAGCLKELKVPGGSAADWNTSNSAYSDVPVSPLATFDSTGLVFAVTAPMAANSTAATAAGGGGQHLHLYDARNYTGGAFTEWQVHTWSMLEQCMPQHVHVTPEQVSQLARAPWTLLQFNVSGNQHLVGTAAGLCIVLDGFEGTIQRIFSSTSQCPTAVCFTANDKTVLVGNDNGSVTAWSLEAFIMIQTLGDQRLVHKRFCVQRYRRWYLVLYVL